MENTVITINYYTGKMTLVLDNFIPAQSGQFRVVVDAVSKSDDPDRNAATIYNFIVGHVDDLKNLRSHCEPSNDSGKKQIADLTAKIKKYISNIEVLRKYFPDLPEISDGEKIILKAATVYAIMRNPETRSNEIQGFHGWTFEKYGRKFEVRKDCKTYKIMPAGTGLACAEVSSRQKISAAVTEKLIGILKKADLVETAQKHFEELYENTESIYFPDENMTVQKATPAAVKADPEPVKADPEPVKADPEPVKADPEPVKADPVTAENHSEKKTGRTEVPEKTFIGQKITGPGYEIYFNPETCRTEIRTGSKKHQADAAAAGFYKSFRGTYNKKLTWKAYRAAVKLSEKWNAA